MITGGPSTDGRGEDCRDAAPRPDHTALFQILHCPPLMDVVEAGEVEGYVDCIFFFRKFYTNAGTNV